MCLLLLYSSLIPALNLPVNYVVVTPQASASTSPAIDLLIIQYVLSDLDLVHCPELSLFIEKLLSGLVHATLKCDGIWINLLNSLPFMHCEQVFLVAGLILKIVWRHPFGQEVIFAKIFDTFCFTHYPCYVLVKSDLFLNQLK